MCFENRRGRVMVHGRDSVMVHGRDNNKESYVLGMHSSNSKPSHVDSFCFGFDVPSS